MLRKMLLLQVGLFKYVLLIYALLDWQLITVLQCVIHVCYFNRQL